MLCSFTAFNCYLHSLVAPEIVEPPQSQEGVMAGNNTSFTCVATGRPAPSINWYRNGVRLESSEKTAISTMTTDESRVTSGLEIRNVTLGDSGTYVCISSSPGGIATASFTLSVSGMSQHTL